MAIKITVYMSTLMRYAYEAGQAKLHGTEKEITEANRKHDEYKAMFDIADEVVVGFPLQL